MDVTSLPSATRLRIPPEAGLDPEGPDLHSKKSFPKSARVLRSSDFRKIYDTGKRYSCAHFAAFYLPQVDAECAHVGFTTPRALGKANVRNLIKRRFREAVRLHLAELSPQWCVVINPRRSSLAIPFAALEAEIRKLFGQVLAGSRHGSSSPSCAHIK